MPRASIGGLIPPVRYILTLSCTDRPGIVAAVATFLAGEGCNILESAQFDDVDTGRFFMRVVCAPVVDGVTRDRIATAFGPVAAGFGMDWQLRDAAQRLRVLIMVSKQDHCLNDLLYRYKVGALHMEPVAIVSNHRDSDRLAASYDIPFHHLPVTAATKPAAGGEAARRCSRSTASTWSCSRATCRCCPTTSRASSRAGRSTSTTRSCPPSRAPSRTTRRTRAASS